MNTAELPPGVSIGAPPPELELDTEEGTSRYDPHYWQYDRHRRDDAEDNRRRAKAFPQPIVVGTPEELIAKVYGVSGSIDSTRYREATRFTDMRGMTWPVARIALNRLMPRYGRGTAADYVAMAEFALSARGFNFEGLKGDAAPKFRRERADAVAKLGRYLRDQLDRADHAQDNRPIAAMWPTKNWPANAVLDTMVPTAPEQWVRVIEATGAEALAALGFLRATLAEWASKRSIVEDVAQRLDIDAEVTAAEYADALHNCLDAGLRRQQPGDVEQRHAALDAGLPAAPWGARD
jgi:hypothetical protein